MGQLFREVKKVELHIKNQLNDGLTIEFCVGDKEYTLEYEEETVIEVTEDVCMYLDIVTPKR